MVTAYHNVTVLRRDNHLVFPTPASLLGYANVLLRSAFDLPARAPQGNVVWEVVRREAETWLTHHGGAWRDPKGYTVFTSTV